MVQTEVQYVFIYRAVGEMLCCGVTEIYAQNLAGRYRELKGSACQGGGVFAGPERDVVHVKL